MTASVEHGDWTRTTGLEGAMRDVRLTAAFCALGFGGFLAWAAFVPLAEGITASGHVIVETDRKQIQHLEGGIIRELYVREGETVNAGDVLLVLDPLQPESARDELAQTLYTYQASLARLTQLREGLDTYTPPTPPKMVRALIASDIVDRQRILFSEQRAALAAERAVFIARRRDADAQAEELAAQIRAARESLRQARDEYALRQEMLEEQLETVTNVRQLGREVSEAERRVSELESRREQALRAALEYTEQLDEVDARNREDISSQILDLQTEALGTQERLTAMDDRLARTTIAAPIGGEVLNMAFSTVGGVVGPGEAILELVPHNDRLIASIRLNPADRDAVAPGQIVEAQLTAYRSFVAPRLAGEVLGVSADLKRDESTGVSYYEARVSLGLEEVADGQSVAIIPGMPVDAFIASGQKRTLLDYVFEPIITTLSRGARMT